MVIDPPPSHRAGRYLVAAALLVAFLAAIIAALAAVDDSGLIDDVRARLMEMRK